MSNDFHRREFYDALYSSMKAAQDPDATAVPSPRGPLKVETNGSVTSFFGVFNFGPWRPKPAKLQAAVSSREQR